MNSLYSIFCIARREFRILVRGRWGLGLLLFFTIYSVGVIGFGTSKIGPGSYESVIISLVEFGVYLIPLAALTVGYDTVVGGYQSGTLDMLFALPVTRTQILTGKYLGRLGVLVGALITGLCAGGTIAIYIVGWEGVALYSLFIIASAVTAASFLGLSVLISSLTDQRIRALAYSQIGWLWFVLLHDLFALGLIVEFNLPDGVLNAMVLSNPTDLYRLVLLGQVKAPAGGFAELLAETSMTMPVLVLGMAVWFVGPPIAANVVIRGQ